MSAATISDEIRDPEEANAFLLAGACLARLGTTARNEQDLAPLARRVQALIIEAGALPPPGIVADVAHLLLGGTCVLSKNPPSPSPELNRAIHLYEDRFLARLAEDVRLPSAQDAIAKLSPESRDAAIAVFTARLLARIKYSGAAAVSAAVGRRAQTTSAREQLRRGHELLAGRELGGGDQAAQSISHEELSARLLRGYSSLIDAARRAPAFISEADIFLLESFASLGDLGRRVALEQALEAADQLSQTLPRRIKPSARAKRGIAATKIEDEDKYPIGGFSAIATSGSLENMVTSELIYMNDTVDPEEIDLFDLRFVEGELLYFTRDESVFLRKHRDLIFVFEAGLAPARVRDSGAPWQRVIMALGALACIARRISDWLRGEDLRFRVVFAGAARGGPEPALASLLLREWIDKGAAEVVEISENDAEYYFTFDLSLPMTFEEWTERTRGMLQSIIDGA